MSHGQAPTSKQLAYLRVLAQQTGTTFIAPQDRRQASREIQRLRSLKRRQSDRPEPPTEAVGYGTAPQPSEIAGWGTSARWRNTTHARLSRHTRTRVERAASASRYGTARSSVQLATYEDSRSRTRELITVELREGTLVIDRVAGTRKDARVVGRLGRDEPPENAKLLADLYVKDPSRGHCRGLTNADLEADHSANPPDSPVRWDAPLAAGAGIRLQIGLVDVAGAHHLRWTERCGPDDRPRIVSVRHVIGKLQDYEPMIAMTRAAVAAHQQDPKVTVCGLRVELQRACNSPIVLNRRLRERVEQAVERDGLSMSEIAIRCRRVKRDARGRESGETSWLARRTGMLAEAGAPAPTPWIHTDVLALIARDGLGISPREAEV